jgi:hypothetical protein
MLGGLFGTLIDWGYLVVGVLAWTPEIWASGAFDYDGDGRVSDLERMRWNEEEWGGRVFVDWTETEHPMLGTVEVGGWRNDFDAHGMTPPEGFRYRSEQIRPWFLYVLEALPRLVLKDVRSEEIGNGLYSVSVVVKNEGFLDTPVTEHAARLFVERGLETDNVSFLPFVPPVKATLSPDGSEIVGEATLEIGHLRGIGGGANRVASLGWPNEASASWVVRGSRGSRVVVEARSPRAGVARATVTLGVTGGTR